MEKQKVVGVVSVIRTPVDQECPSCKGKTTEQPHICPFADEIYGTETMCKCCKSCTEECARDI